MIDITFIRVGLLFTFKLVLGVVYTYLNALHVSFLSLIFFLFVAGGAGSVGLVAGLAVCDPAAVLGDPRPGRRKRLSARGKVVTTKRETRGKRRKHAKIEA